MTIPHLMNCAHSAEGWCLDCVKKLHDENERLTQELHEDGDGDTWREACGRCEDGQMLLFKLLFENDAVICKLVFDHGPHFESLEDGGRVTDTPEEIVIIKSVAPKKETWKSKSKSPKKGNLKI